MEHERYDPGAAEIEMQQVTPGELLLSPELS